MPKVSRLFLSTFVKSRLEYDFGKLSKNCKNCSHSVHLVHRARFAAMVDWDITDHFSAGISFTKDFGDTNTEFKTLGTGTSVGFSLRRHF
jgi:hypothetical protein